MKLIIFSTFKPMIPAFITEQTNSLNSWKALRYDKKIIIIGNDEGVEKLCKEKNVIHHPEVKKNNYDTPLVSDIFKIGWSYASEDDICIFLNGDIILSNSLCDVIDRFIKEYPNYKDINYFLTAIRYDWTNFKHIDFTDENWEKKIKTGMRGKYSPPNGIDLYIHKKNTLEIPKEFAIAKMSYDGYIMNYVNTKFPVTIDITKSTTIYHQFGKWYQNKKVCGRNTSTQEIKAQVKFGSNKLGSKKNITNCKIKW